jgi:type I restriction enzyme S subunit
MMQFRAGTRWDSRFLMWELNSKAVYQQGVVDTVGATSPHVNVETIRNYWLAEPPPVEQRMIGDYLDRETNKIDRMVAKVEEAIERLQEYRTALITAAVTGKIDVRNVRNSGESRTSGLANDTGHRPSPV